ncbi:MAG: hypothetical protein ACRYFZ_04385 [Janthinobacterium lividum]
MSDIFFFFGILWGFALLVLPLLTLLHELGHAVPALLFTRADVTMYLGSYGDQTNSWRVKIGLLEVYMKRSLFWRTGLCVHTGSNLSKAENCVIILGGVLVSVLVAALGFYAALAGNLHGAVKLFMFLLVLFAVVSLVTNLVPSQRGGLPNDGLLLKLLLAGRGLAVSFTPELKALIGQSRAVAIDLGYDYISTLHLLLADLAMPYPYSLAGLFFPDPEARAAFYESQRLGPANLAARSLPLTVEFEEALKLAPMSQPQGFRSELYPCHLFLAASQVASSEFSQLVPASSSLYQQLLAYYRTFDELMGS